MFENRQTDPKPAQILSTRPSQYLPAQSTRPIWKHYWMDAQRTCIWRTVNSSVTAHDFLQSMRFGESKRESYIHAEMTCYM